MEDDFFLGGQTQVLLLKLREHLDREERSAFVLKSETEFDDLKGVYLNLLMKEDGEVPLHDFHLDADLQYRHLQILPL